MKKKAIVIAAVAVVLIMAIFLIFRDQPFNQQFRETTAGLTSYLLEGDMEITKGEDIKSYALSVKYLKEQEQDYFRVSLTDKDLNQEQEIIRNQEGVYVITPSLNQIFKFEGNWPTNSLKPYLLQSMGEIMDQDGVQVEKTADGYRVSATVTYPNNHNFNVQEMLFDADAKIQYLEIFNADHVSQLKLSFTKVDYAPGLTVEDFAIPDQLEKQTAEAQAETDKVIAESEAKVKVIQAQAEADANRIIAQSITPELIQMTEAQARVEHGWVTVQGAETVVSAQP